MLGYISLKKTKPELVTKERIRGVDGARWTNKAITKLRHMSQIYADEGTEDNVLRFCPYTLRIPKNVCS